MPYNNEQIQPGDGVKTMKTESKPKKPVTHVHIFLVILAIIFLAVVAFAQLFPETENVILKLLSVSYSSDTAVILSVTHA